MNKKNIGGGGTEVIFAKRREHGNVGHPDLLHVPTKVERRPTQHLGGRARLRRSRIGGVIMVGGAAYRDQPLAWRGDGGHGWSCRLMATGMVQGGGVGLVKMAYCTSK